MKQKTKDKISKSNKGKIRTEEHKKNISNGCIGRILSNETKNKISKSNKLSHLKRNYEEIYTEETRCKISKSLKDYYKNSPGKYENYIVAFHSNCIVDVYKSTNECCNMLLNMKKDKYIYKILKGEKNNYKGYTFKKLKDILPPFHPSKINIIK